MFHGRAVKLTLEPGHTLLLSGPAQFTVKAGDAYSLAGALKRDTLMTVEETRREPIFSPTGSELELRLGPGSMRTDVPESTIPASWSEAAQILQQQRGIVVIVGEVDSGKSTLCTFLANKCFESGLRVGLIDGDVGQSDIGPPATVGTGTIRQPIRGLQEAESLSSFFVGETSPSIIPAKVIRLLTRLKEEIERASDVVIINTDGWIGEPNAMRYKSQLIEETRPDLALALVRGDELNQILDNATCATLRLTISPFARTRSKIERKRNREVGYRRFLTGSRILRVSEAESRLRMFDRPGQSVFQGEQRRLRGYLVGLLAATEKLLAIGRIRNVRGREILVETLAEDKPTLVEIGNIVLSSKFEEVGYGNLQ
jgi:polynucleotide 5'-hydroxyl-kinase GRC3/NOL9